ncbi:MAG: DMT family transporter [bacterium]|nr:DMT family transporter [bacterium]
MHLFYFIMTALFWGGSFLAIRIAVQNFPPFFAAGLRVFIGLVCIGGYLLIKKKKIRRPHNWLAMMMAGVIWMGLAWIFLFWGEQYVAPALAAVLNSTVPIFTVLLTPLITPSDKPNLKKWIGVLLGCGGVAVIFYPELSKETTLYTYGLMALALMSLSYATGALLTRRLSHTDTGPLTAFYQCAGALILLVLASFLFERNLPIHWTNEGVLALLYLGIFSTAIAFIFFFKLIKERGSVEASAVTLCVPLVAIVLDAIFLRRFLPWNQTIGAIIILLSVGLIHWKRRSL